MGEFFHGQRRKMGVVTLFMALLLCVGWIRGQIVEDEICFGHGKSMVYHSLTSSRNGIAWKRTASPDKVLQYLAWWHCRNVRADHLSGYVIPIAIEWRWRRFGFDFGELLSRGAYTVRIAWALAPYEAIVIPLTLLSAFLLLSKPRPPKARGTANVPDTGSGE